MLQDPVYFAVAMATIASAVGLSAILYRLIGAKSRHSSAMSYSPVRLAPMQRLLASEDFEYLKSQPGYKPEIASQLRARRVTVFKKYLGSMSTEFNQLHRTLRVLTLHAPSDRSEITKLLLEQRILFSVRMMQVDVRLTFYAFGMKPVDVSGLVQSIDAMRQQVRQMSISMEFSPSAA
jgi:hypothetical protein